MSEPTRISVQDFQIPSRQIARPESPYRTLMPLLRMTGYAPDGQPPLGYAESRDASVFKALLKTRTVDDLADALRGVRAVADGELTLPEGGTPWLTPGEKFTARWLYNTRWGNRPLADVARDVWRKGRARKDKGTAAESVASIVGRIA